MKGIDLQNMPSAGASQESWTIDPHFLAEVKREIGAIEPSIDYEEIETVLLALVRLDTKQRMEHNEKAV